MTIVCWILLPGLGGAWLVIWCYLPLLVMVLRPTVFPRFRRQFSTMMKAIKRIAAAVDREV